MNVYLGRVKARTCFLTDTRSQPQYLFKLLLKLHHRPQHNNTDMKALSTLFRIPEPTDTYDWLVLLSDWQEKENIPSLTPGEHGQFWSLHIDLWFCCTLGSCKTNPVVVLTVFNFFHWLQKRTIFPHIPQCLKQGCSAKIYDGLASFSSLFFLLTNNKHDWIPTTVTFQCLKINHFVCEP